MTGPAVAPAALELEVAAAEADEAALEAVERAPARAEETELSAAKREDLAEPVAVAASEERLPMTAAYEELAAAMTLEAVAFIELAPIPAEPVTRAPAAEVML